MSEYEKQFSLKKTPYNYYIKFFQVEFKFLREKIQKHKC